VLKKITVAIVLTLLSLAFTSAAMAGPAKTPPPPKEDFNAQSVTLKSQLYFRSGYSYIIDDGSWISISGVTNATQSVDEISVELYLQKWNGSSWVTIQGPYYYVDYNKLSVDGDKGLQVARGYYYRTYAKHLVREGLVNEPGESWSQSVLAE